MSANHLVSSLISSIKNAVLVRKSSMVVPYSNVIVGILNVLLDEGFINSFEEFEESVNVKRIRIMLKYIRGKSSIQAFQVVSKPGKRIYSSPKSLPSYYDGLGFYIFSTSKGILTDQKARLLNVGGEVLCKVF